MRSVCDSRQLSQTMSVLDILLWTETENKFSRGCFASFLLEKDADKSKTFSKVTTAS